jgi:glycerol-3-phosphate dehydrogenase
VPEVSLDYAIKSFAALRPACEEVFFVRPDARVPNLLHAVSRSIGVSTSPGIADYMLGLLVDAGLDVSEKSDPIMAIPALPPLRHTEDPTDLDDLHPRYRQIVCVCEQVSAAEIEGALTAEVPAVSVEGVRKRTGATGGRCQGSVCLAGVSFMCSMHTHDAPENVMVNDKGRVGIGR